MDRVFILGDSRTGTTSLHKFFLDLGYNSIHYYANLEGLQRPISSDLDGNWQKLKKFYLTTSYNAFSDYPTRIFYKELYDLFPESYFILSKRESLEKWKSSMRSFFAKRGNKTDWGMKIDIEALAKRYVNGNEEIARFFAERPDARFLELTIDADSEANSEALKAFLSRRDSPVTLKKLNQTR